MKFVTPLWAFVGLVFCIFTGYADVLFIDLNGSSAELAVARAAARSRVPPEELVVVGGAAIDTARIEIAISRMERDAQKNPVRAMSSMVVSGHSSGSAFWGSHAAMISESDLDEIFKRHPVSKSSLRAVYLWGCHSGEFSSLLWWKSRFPELGMILGFNGTAPEGDLPSSPAILGNAMRREHKATRISDEKSARKMFDAIRSNFTEPLTGVFGGCYADAVTAEALNSVAQRNCPYAAHDIEYLNRVFAAYYEAPDVPVAVGYGDSRNGVDGPDERLSDPPANTHLSDLRSFYNMLQAYEHCSSAFPPQTPTIEKTLSLIFFRNVRANFYAYYKKQIAAVNELLLKSGHAELQIPDLSAAGVTRHQILEKTNRLLSYYIARRSLHDEARLQPLGEVVNLLDHMLKKLECVPANWSTEPPSPGHTPEAPLC